MVSDADRDAEAAIERAARGRAPRRRPAGRGGRAQRGDERPALGRRPARRHHQLPLRLPGLGGERRARGRARAALVGVVHDPVRGRDLHRRARRGRAPQRRADRRERRATGSTRALVATGFGYERRAPRARRRELLARRAPRACATSAAPAPPRSTSCWVAAGRLDGYYERGLKPWDWAAGSLIVQRGGRRSCDTLAGEPAGLVAASPGIAERAAGAGGVARAPPSRYLTVSCPSCRRPRGRAPCRGTYLPALTSPETSDVPPWPTTGPSS